MAAHISVVSGDRVADAESLADWLLGEPELAGRVRLTGREPAPGELGAVLDTLTVAVGAGGAVSVLATALRTWLSHPRRSDVRVKIRRNDGDSVEIDAKRITGAELEAILQRALHDDGQR